MIIDTLDNLEKYAAINPLFPKVVEFLKANDLSKMADGKYEIEGKDLFVNITTTKSKTPDEAVIETHDKMIDIQIPINMEETYGYSPVKGLPEVEFDVENDIAKVPGCTSQFYLKVKPGQFVMFFPQDGHAPCIGEGEIHKAIFKVKY